MNGRLDIESEVGKGSLFYFDLPAGYGPVPDRSFPFQMPEDCGVGDFNKRYKILYVEDNPFNVGVIREALKMTECYDLEVAFNGQDGIKAAMKTRPDLLLLDISMSGMNGIEILRRLRAEAKTRNIPAIALSADALQSEIDCAMDAGFLDYLTKPIDFQILFSRLDNIFKKEPMENRKSGH